MNASTLHTAVLYDGLPMNFRLMQRILYSLFLLLAPLALRAGEPSDFVRPPYLRLGDTVGLVAPAGRLPATVDTARIRELFASWGLHAKFAPHCCDAAEPYFSASDADRAADLQAMIADSSVRAVVACRGGYGSVRLLPLLRLEELRWNPKWLVGFSDITTLHLALARIGVESIHGPMPGSALFWEEEASIESLRRALFGLTRRVDVPYHRLDVAGTASGRLVGGNLAMLCAACGTSEELGNEEPTVLFIEEVNEPVYRVDRMLRQLLRSGALSSVQAVVVGDFTRMSGAEQYGAEACETIAGALAPLGIPLLFGFPAGHDKLNVAIYLGRTVRVTVGEEGGSVIFEEE